MQAPKTPSNGARLSSQWRSPRVAGWLRIPTGECPVCGGKVPELMMRQNWTMAQDRLDRFDVVLARGRRSSPGECTEPGTLQHCSSQSDVTPRRFSTPSQIRLPEIFNNVGPVKSSFCSFLRFFVKSFFEHTTAFTPKSGLPRPLFGLCIDDHGSLIIYRSASVRPKHLFDPYFESR